MGRDPKVRPGQHALTPCFSDAAGQADDDGDHVAERGEGDQEVEAAHDVAVAEDLLEEEGGGCVDLERSYRVLSPTLVSRSCLFLPGGGRQEPYLDLIHNIKRIIIPTIREDHTIQRDRHPIRKSSRASRPGVLEVRFRTLDGSCSAQHHEACDDDEE